MNARCRLILQSYQHKFLPTIQRTIKYSGTDSQISTKQKQDKKNFTDQKQAISQGPDFEDFLSGNVDKQETWKDYSGDLVKTKEMKRWNVWLIKYYYRGQ